METRGSARIDTLKDSGYKVSSCTGPGRYILVDGEGNAERWYGSKTPTAGYNIKYGPWYLEFVGGAKPEVRKEAEGSWCDCPMCDGDGYIKRGNNDADCPKCKGEGLVNCSYVNEAANPLKSQAGENFAQGIDNMMESSIFMKRGLGILFDLISYQKHGLDVAFADSEFKEDIEYKMGVLLRELEQHGKDIRLLLSQLKKG